MNEYLYSNISPFLLFILLRLLILLVFTVIDCDLHPLQFEYDDYRSSIITGSGDGTIKFWNTKRETPVKSIEAHDEAIYASRFSTDGR